MKKSLIKMRVCLGFDCNPRLDVISYDDEVTDDGMAYQSTRGIRNEKTLVKLGQSWMRFDSSTKEPYWDSYVIVDASISESERAEIAMDLYENAINEMSRGVEEMTRRFKELKLPSQTEVENSIKAKLSGIGANGIAMVTVPVEDFKRLIGDNVKASGMELAKNHGFSVDKWNEFYDKTLTPDILTILMKGLPVLKFNGNGINFQTREMYEQALVAVSGKVTSDVFARFVEEMTSTAKNIEA